MKRILYVDCIGGASGDMWLGALSHLGVPKEVLEKPINAIKSEGWRLDLASASINGIHGTRASVHVDGESAHPASHGHPHGAKEGHGVSYESIRNLLTESPLDSEVQSLALRVFETLAKAEGTIHGVAPEKVHFHEVGALDALVDILGTCAGIIYLQLDEVVASPIPTGSGRIQCAHGWIPIPAPATAEILKGLQTIGTGLQGEMVTPTGAALIKAIATTSGTTPLMTTSSVGYGLGKKEWPDRPNALRLLVGESQDVREELIVMETNIDDMNPEWFTPLTESLFNAGALDVWCTPIQMKKGRLATLLSVLAPQSLRHELTKQIFRGSTTLGIRAYPVDRDIRERKIMTHETSLGTCRFKIAETPGGTPLISAEFDDCVALSKEHNLPVRTVNEQVMQEIRHYLGSKGELL